MSLKLYKVTLKGMTTSHGSCYVVATDPTSAYEKVKHDLDESGLGFAKDRELSTIELLAEDVEYPNCGTRLYF